MLAATRTVGQIAAMESGCWFVNLISLEKQGQQSSRPGANYIK
jgi:hypothetical protein